MPAAAVSHKPQATTARQAAGLRSSVCRIPCLTGDHRGDRRCSGGAAASAAAVAGASAGRPGRSLRTARHPPQAPGLRPAVRQLFVRSLTACDPPHGGCRLLGWECHHRVHFGAAQRDMQQSGKPPRYHTVDRALRCCPTLPDASKFNQARLT